MQGSIRTTAPGSIPLGALLLILFGSPGTGASPSRYVCTNEQSVGLHYDKPPGRWTPHAFVPARYVLRKLTLADQDVQTQKYAPILNAFPEATWVFFGYGETHPQPVAACRQGKAEYGASFVCDPISADARFDPGSRRFQIVRSQGFIAQALAQAARKERSGASDPKDPTRAINVPDKPDDLVIKIGTCVAE